MKFRAILWKRLEDREGEITLVLKVPLSDAKEAKEIPTQKVIDIVAKISEEEY